MNSNVQATKRLISLDVFRGITIVGMILVNNPGTWSDVYPALRHAAWHGWTPTDFIFPFFLFIVGVSMTLSFQKRMGKGDDRKKLFMHAFQRSYIIFGLGLFLHLFPYFNFTTVRLPGVLQRIAVVYLLASFIYLYSDFKWQVYISLALLLLYWAAMALIPVPGYGMNNLSTEGNLAAYIDNTLLHGHTWKATWDPEGILSTFPAVVTTMIGIFTGRWIQKEKSHFETVSGMFVAGSFLLVVGVIWDMWFPINKYIWTSSYVIFMGGMALLFLGVCFYLIEIKNIKWWTQPFLVYGMNAIASFFLSSLVAKLMGIIKFTGADGNEISLKGYIFANIFSGISTPINSSLFFALSYILLWYLLMLILYKKKIFIKV
ncbi:MAG: DUF5009 domain-containing protein [Ignavibacteria bacterium]|nr:DUF5009 domain-containing protein [Ignavibacteria bacterium]